MRDRIILTMLQQEAPHVISLAHYGPEGMPQVSNCAVIEHIMGSFGSRLGKPPYGSSEMELTSPIGEGAYAEFIEWVTSLPEGRGRELFREGLTLKYISDNQATFLALERMYRGPFSNSDALLHAWDRLSIENIHHSMAVRNRARLVAKIFSREMRERLVPGEERIEVLGVAAGSSRAILEAKAQLPARVQDNVGITIVDQDERVGPYAFQVAAELDISRKMTVKTLNVLRHRGKYLISGYHPDIVEIVGLFDYLNDRQILFILGPIIESMKTGSVALVSNMNARDDKAFQIEERFRMEVVGWQELYNRNADHLMSLVASAGPVDIKLIPEPLGMYNLVQLTKK